MATFLELARQGGGIFTGRMCVLRVIFLFVLFYTFLHVAFTRLLFCVNFIQAKFTVK